jgi:hypothetical protein
MNAPDEHLLGFDARLVPAPWPEEHRSQYLLRDDVAAALTVDINTWPTYFGKGATRPQWIGVFDPLWSDLDELRACLAKQVPTSPVLLVAVTVHVAEKDGLKTYFEEHCGVTNMSGTPFAPDACAPRTRDPNWRLLGYDLVGSFGISGLSDCGYSPDERAALAPIWAPRLNRDHLFDQLVDANSFRDVTDPRVPEHAPFYVNGLWLIERID